MLQIISKLNIPNQTLRHITLRLDWSLLPWFILIAFTFISAIVGCTFLVVSLKYCFMFFLAVQWSERKRSWVINLNRLGLPPSTMLPLHPVYDASHQSSLLYQPVVSETGILSKLKGILGPGGQQQQAGPQILGTQQGSAPVLSHVPSHQ